MKFPYCLPLLLAAGLAQAQNLSVKDPWVRATVAPQTVTGAFMTLTADQPLKLVAIRSPLAGMAEVHEMKMDGGVMKMRALDALPLPAGQAVSLQPGSYHVMLMGLKQPIKAGDSVPLTLVVEGADKKTRTIEVKAVARAGS